MPIPCGTFPEAEKTVILISKNSGGETHFAQRACLMTLFGILTHYLRIAPERAERLIRVSPAYRRIMAAATPADPAALPKRHRAARHPLSLHPDAEIAALTAFGSEYRLAMQTVYGEDYAAQGYTADLPDDYAQWSAYYDKNAIRPITDGIRPPEQSHGAFADEKNGIEITDPDTGATETFNKRDYLMLMFGIMTHYLRLTPECAEQRIRQSHFYRHVLSDQQLHAPYGLDYVMHETVYHWAMEAAYGGEDGLYWTRGYDSSEPDDYTQWEQHYFQTVITPQTGSAFL
ncbi:hypothetical protein ACLD9W_02745 [Neisseria sp. WLZKY-1]|uniref:hypothetical protein n=1 Tax=Neisseria sp. WLZKY-1 TaxID=3390377 RepID=UPI00397D1FF9